MVRLYSFVYGSYTFQLHHLFSLLLLYPLINIRLTYSIMVLCVKTICFNNFVFVSMCFYPFIYLNTIYLNYWKECETFIKRNKKLLYVWISLLLIYIYYFTLKYGTCRAYHNSEISIAYSMFSFRRTNYIIPPFLLLKFTLYLLSILLWNYVLKFVIYWAWDPWCVDIFIKSCLQECIYIYIYIYIYSFLLFLFFTILSWKRYKKCNISRETDSQFHPSHLLDIRLLFATKGKKTF